MTVMARYSGVCPDCGERWQPGDLIRANKTKPGDLPEWRHVVCLDPLETTNKACPVCWLTHPEGACDR